MLLSLVGTLNAQTDEAVLIFKRPFPNLPDLREARIDVNGVRSCVIDSEPYKSIASCELKVKAGEVKVKTSSSRGDDYEYVFDALKGKTYTLVVYSKGLQNWDLLWSTLSEPLVKNKVEELPEYSIFTFKVQAISIK
jgi:hypothetical protein